MDGSLSNFEMNVDQEDEELDVASAATSSPDDASDVELQKLAQLSTENSNPESDAENSPEDVVFPEMETVTKLVHQPTNTKVYLVGTAHFSKESNQDVVTVISKVKPDMVLLELCSARGHILAQDEETILQEVQDMTMDKLIKHIQTNGVYNGIMYFFMLKMSANITQQIGMAPGGEFRAAYREALKLPNCEILLGDRPLHITMKRALARLTWWQTIKIAWHVMVSKDEVSVEDIEKCKKQDMLEQLLSELSGEYPAFKDVFLTERDIFLTNGIQSAIYARMKRLLSMKELNPQKPLRLVAVVGIGHVPGIVRLWPADQRKKAIEMITVPPPSLSGRILKFTIKGAMVGGCLYLICRLIKVPPSLKENTIGTVKKIATSVIGGASTFIHS